MLAAMIYAVIYRWSSLRSLIALGSFSCVFYYSIPAVFVIETANGFLTTLWVLVMMEMAVWVAPKTAEAAAFALLMGAYNPGSAVGDYLFSDLMDWSVLGFSGIAGLSAAGTVLMIILLQFLPKDLFGPPER
jgi:hypothetical protein